MKCENCGNEEVNFHFTAEINGNITEKHLCTECAGKLGYMGKSDNKPEASFEDVFTDLFGARPSRRVFSGYGLMLPTFIIPTVGVFMPNAGYEEDDETETDKPVEIKQEIDLEMQRRRELNIMREQMKKAAEAEEFERAAALRDSIKSLENGENS